MSARSIALALILPALMLVPVVALGDGEQAAHPKKKLPPAAGDIKYDPEGIVAISEFQETVTKGNTMYASKDYTGATDTYKRAIQLAPKNALGPYLLAEAYLATSNIPEADAAIASAVDLAPTDAKQSSLATRARVLFLRADIYERQKKWDQAKTTWQQYVDVSGKLTGDGGAFPATGQERIRALQKVIDLEKQYAPVRERIAADKADAGKAPPPKKK